MDEETTLSAPAASAEPSHLDGDAATVASHDTFRSYRSYDNGKSRGYSTDSASHRRRIDDKRRYCSRGRNRSRDPNSTRCEVSRSRDRSVTQSRHHSRDRYDDRSTDRCQKEGHDSGRYQRGESYAPSADGVHQYDDRRDYCRGRSSSIASTFSEPPFKRGRRFGSLSKSRSPGRLMRSQPAETLEWPPCFDVDGTAFVFHPASGMFYEEKSEFFYDPKTKLYYGAKKAAYFSYDESRDPPFVETQRADPSQGTPTEAVAPPVTLPPLNATSGQDQAEKPKIAIKLKTKKVKKPKANVKTEASEAMHIPASKIHKEQVANIEKWKEKQAELKTLPAIPATLPMPVSAAVAMEEIKRTVKGEPICVVCKRKFATVEKLRLHESKSDLHKANVAKAPQHAGEKRKQEAVALTDQQDYNDRAEKRRQLHAFDVTDITPVEVGIPAHTITPSAPEGLGEQNIGNKLLQKMGWQTGGAIGKKGVDGGSEKCAAGLRKDWDRIEAMAASGAPPRSGQ